jgi:hypothetical protein
MYKIINYYERVNIDSMNWSYHSIRASQGLYLLQEPIMSKEEKISVENSRSIINDIKMVNKMLITIENCVNKSLDNKIKHYMNKNNIPMKRFDIMKKWLMRNC